MGNQATKEAIKACGGASAVSAALQLSYEAVRKWIVNDRIPAEQVLNVENLCDGRVSRYRMRPDVYGPEPS